MVKSISPYLTIIYFVLLQTGLFLFPILVLPFFTDPFALPKQGLLIYITFSGFILWGLKSVVERKVTIRTTPLFLPLCLFFAVVAISSLIPLFQTDANLKTPLIGAFPLLTLILFYIVTVNLVKTERETRILMWSLIGGAVLAGLFSILNGLKIYVLPFPEIHHPAFNTFGNLLQTLLFFAGLLPLLLFGAASSLFRKDVLSSERQVAWFGFLISSVILIAATGIILYQLFTSQKPAIFPQTFGLQTATGAIGQNFQTLLFGSSPGTYISDFTRFKSADFNQLDVWNLRFFASSSLFLEILATLGLLGILSFAFLAYKFLRNLPTKEGRFDETSIGLFLGALVLFILALILPFTFTTIALLFILLSLFAVSSQTLDETTLFIVALPKSANQNILPVVTLGIVALLSASSLYFTTLFLLSDIRFQESIVAAVQGRGTDTYNKQREAILLFPHRDGYLRTFSQTNLALANALSTPGRELTDADKQTIVALVQQAIANARGAVTLFPLNVMNWENLASIYRSLIGFGENAEGFAIASAQQAVRLDPTNPQIYLFLGGIYYQLANWEAAQAQFQSAVNLKPDFANAYYNLGHVLESKGDLKAALAQYRVVQNLIAAQPETEIGKEENKKKIDSEIEVLTKRIGEIEAEEASKVKPTAGEQPPLSIGTPSAKFPPQKPPVKIPEPPTATEAAR